VEAGDVAFQTETVCFQAINPRQGLKAIPRREIAPCQDGERSLDSAPAALRGEPEKVRVFLRLLEFVTPIRSWRLLLLVAIILTLFFVHQSGVVQRSPFHQVLDTFPIY
jgi:hypothetical protein